LAILGKKSEGNLYNVAKKSHVWDPCFTRKIRYDKIDFIHKINFSAFSILSSLSKFLLLQNIFQLNIFFKNQKVIQKATPRLQLTNHTAVAVLQTKKRLASLPTNKEKTTTQRTWSLSTFHVQTAAESCEDQRVFPGF
jgi:hypothetical protein